MEQTNVSLHVFIEVFILILGLSGCILMQFSNEQSKPYMDEIFHVPQAQKYCEGKYEEWDPMITTLPGLYIVSSGILSPAAHVLGYPASALCSTFGLRCVNVAFTLGNLCILMLLRRKIHPDTQESVRDQLTALSLATFPVLYFFTFLFYTDCGSVFFTLLMYLLSLHGRHTVGAAVGVIAILFRQTNVVWVVFAAAKVVEEELLEYVQPEKKDIPKEDFSKVILLKAIFRQLCISDVKSLVNLTLGVLKHAWAYVLVGMGFVVFVVKNGGIVVGAKDDHQMVLHVPQVFYLASFMAAWSFMHILSVNRLKRFFHFVMVNKILVVLSCIICAVLVWKFTFAHRYLLSDNRHYTFYLWARIYQRHYLVKYFLIPCYLCAIWCIWDTLVHKSILWKCAFAFCVFVNLVPSPLLEFRYFIMPFFIYRLNITVNSYWTLAIELLLYSFVNALTIYVFLEREFYWPGTESVQRFMW